MSTSTYPQVMDLPGADRVFAVRPTGAPPLTYKEYGGTQDSKTVAISLGLHALAVLAMVASSMSHGVHLVPTRPDSRTETLNSLFQWHNDVKVSDVAGSRAGAAGHKGGSSFKDRRTVVKVYQLDPVSEAVVKATPDTSKKLMSQLADVLTLHSATQVTLEAPVIAKPKQFVPEPKQQLAMATNPNPKLPLFQPSKADVRLEQKPVPPEPEKPKEMSKELKDLLAKKADTVQHASDVDDMLVMRPNPGSDVQTTEIKLGSFSATIGTEDTKGRGAGDGGAGAADSGSGSGNAETANGSGAAASGTGLGKDGTVGITIGNGGGGAGANSAATLRSNGVYMSGGAVFVPSFTGNAPPSSGPKDASADHDADIVVVSTSSSSDSLGSYHYLRGQVFTTYVSAMAGNLVIEFEDPRRFGQGGLMTAPEPLQIPMPASQNKGRWIIGAQLRADGKLDRIETLLSGNLSPIELRQMLATWRFRPALAGGKPVATQVMIGLNVTSH